MDSMTALHLKSMDEMRRQLVETVKPMTDDQVNAPVATFTNTVGIIVRHLADLRSIGSARSWEDVPPIATEMPSSAVIG